MPNDGESPEPIPEDILRALQEHIARLVEEEGLTLDGYHIGPDNTILLVLAHDPKAAAETSERFNDLRERFNEDQPTTQHKEQHDNPPGEVR